MSRTTTSTVTGPQYGETREMPWNVMGKALRPTQTTDLAKAMAATEMDFDVEVWDTIAVDPITGRQMDSPKAAQIVRPIPSKGLAVVGSTGRRFTPIQNRDAFAVAMDLMKAGATIGGLADIRHGGASFLALDLHRDMTVTVKRHADVTSLNLLIVNGHDGNSALTFALTPVRIACTNALQGAIRGADRVWKMSHTPNAEQRVTLARESIIKAAGFAEAFQAKAQKMANQRMVDAEFAKIVANLPGLKVADDAAGKVADRKRETQAGIISLYRESPTLDGIRGTVWGGYNALTEYLDHYRPVKGNARLTRAEGQIDGPNVRVKANLFRQFAGA